MAVTNKLFVNNSTLKDINSSGNNMVSKIRVNREYLISKEIADELNTYRTFDPFPTFNDLFAPEYDTNDPKYKEITEKDPKKGSGTPGVRSIFNKTGAVIIGATSQSTSDIITKEASAFRISNNVPLMDNKATRQAIKRESKCTVKDLVKASQEGLLGRETYSYSDFMYCKYLGRISNNYMVTLRRFPYPVDDFISTLGVGAVDRTNKDYTTFNSDSIGCLVTWMGTPGNEMENILKYSVNMPFTEQTAKFQDAGVDADAGGGILNGIAAAFDPAYRKQYMNSQAGTSLNKVFQKFAPFNIGDPHYPAQQWNNYRDEYSKVYGPIDVVKKIYMRGDEGLNFDQNITLTFDYELRSYNGINGRQAMLDLISNILNVTYSTGTFWGGGYRGGGAHQNNIFTNLNIYKNNIRGWSGFIDALIEDCSTLSSKFSSAIQSNGGIIQTLQSLINNVGGLLIAGALNKLGRPVKQFTNALLSPAPVGFWHVTIGNPHHPIMSMGNMILKNATINHYGPLGIDDFPTGIRVVCELSRGKVRDIRDIEKLYMHGNDRIYTSMGPKIFDMYQHSQEYRGINGKVDSNPSYYDGNPDTDATKTPNANMKNDMNKVLTKYFGHSNRNSIMIAAMEQENGSIGKKKTGAAGGNSSQKGNKF